MSEIVSRQVGEIYHSDNEVLRISEERDDRGRVRVKFTEWYRKGNEWCPRKAIEFKVSQSPAVVSAVLSVRPR